MYYMFCSFNICYHWFQIRNQLIWVSQHLENGQGFMAVYFPGTCPYRADAAVSYPKSVCPPLGCILFLFVLQQPCPWTGCNLTFFQSNATLCFCVEHYLHQADITAWERKMCYVIFRGCPTNELLEPWVCVCEDIIHHCCTKPHPDILQFILKVKETFQLNCLKL